MDEATELHVKNLEDKIDDLKTSIGTSIEEIKKNLQRLIDLDERRRQEMFELQKSFDMHCQSCVNNQDRAKASFKNLDDMIKKESEDRKTAIQELKNKPEETKKAVQWWVDMISKIAPWFFGTVGFIVYSYLKKLGVL